MNAIDDSQKVVYMTMISEEQDIELAFDLPSNFKYPKGPRFIIQAWSSCHGWLDTIHTCDSAESVTKKAISVWNNPDHWIGGKPTKLRIVQNKSLFP